VALRWAARPGIDREPGVGQANKGVVMGDQGGKRTVQERVGRPVPRRPVPEPTVPGLAAREVAPGGRARVFPDVLISELTGVLIMQHIELTKESTADAVLTHSQLELAVNNDRTPIPVGDT